MTDRTITRKEEIMNAAAQGIRRFTTSMRGANLLGAACGVNFAPDDNGVPTILVMCSGQRFRITISEEG